MKNLSLIAAAAVLLVSNIASASIVVASDTFQQDATGTIVGQVGGTGWASAWQSALTTTAPKVVAPATQLDGNRALQLSANNANAAYRVLNTTLSKDVLVDFLFQYTGTIDNNDFLGLWFGSSTGPNIGVKGNCGASGSAISACTNDLFVRTAGAAGAYLSNSNLIEGTTYHVFGHWYKTGAASTAYNQFDAWINPTAAEMSTLTGWNARYTTSSSVTSFNTIGFRTDNLSANDTLRIDDLKISVLPEPSSIALLGLALLGMAGILRKRG